MVTMMQTAYPGNNEAMVAEKHNNSHHQKCGASHDDNGDAGDGDVRDTDDGDPDLYPHSTQRCVYS